jgi:hypothetical protein
MILDIEIYDTSEDDWAQGTYLVHGMDDVLWTDSIDDAVTYLRSDLERIAQQSLSGSETKVSSPKSCGNCSNRLSCGLATQVTCEENNRCFHKPT